jgi:hypothetical protein
VSEKLVSIANMACGQPVQPQCDPGSVCLFNGLNHKYWSTGACIMPFSLAARGNTACNRLQNRDSVDE